MNQEMHLKAVDNLKIKENVISLDLLYKFQVIYEFMTDVASLQIRHLFSVFSGFELNF